MGIVNIYIKFVLGHVSLPTERNEVDTKMAHERTKVKLHWNLPALATLGNPYNLLLQGGGCCRAIQIYTVKLQWLEHLWDHGNLFERWVDRATEI